jgi:hypothetical protein
MNFGEKVAFATIAPWNAEPPLWAILYPTGNGRWIADLVGTRDEAQQQLSRLRRVFRRKAKIHDVNCTR